MAYCRDLFFVNNKNFISVFILIKTYLFKNCNEIFRRLLNMCEMVMIAAIVTTR